MLLNKFKILFKGLCIIATLCFVVFWLVTFLKNEDVSKIEIKYFEKDGDIELPEFTVCFANPFIDDRFKDVNSNLSREGYLSYISGKSSNVALYNYFNYDNVTINFPDYIDSIYFDFRPGFDKQNDTCNNVYDCQYMALSNNMNVFWFDDYFVKCYGTRLHDEYSMHIRFVQFWFKNSFTFLSRNGIHQYLTFNHPNQTLLVEDVTAISRNQGVKLKSIELLKRRNKDNDQCIELAKNFDQYILEKHIKKVGCRAPYQKSLYNISFCETRKEIRKSYFDKRLVLKDHTLPCQSVASMVYTTEKMIDIHEDYVLTVSYPTKIKIITQSQAVDFQAFIGYIGGYIGLFLGNIFLQNSFYRY